MNALVVLRRFAASLTVALLLMGLVLPSAQAAPPNKMGPRPAWGACGLSASPTKLVYNFGKVVLYCGNSSSGYVHIKANHRAQFLTLASAVGRSWEDLVHFSIAWAEFDPDATAYNPANGKACRSRNLWLANDNGLVLSKKTYKVIYVYSTGQVITAFPNDFQCRNQDVGLPGTGPVSTVDGAVEEDDVA